MIGALAIVATVAALAGGRHVMTRAARALASRKAHDEWKRYHREGGEVRHRRTWATCPACSALVLTSVVCVKRGVAAHPSMRDPKRREALDVTRRYQRHRGLVWRVARDRRSPLGIALLFSRAGFARTGTRHMGAA